MGGDEDINRDHERVDESDAFGDAHRNTNDNAREDADTNTEVHDDNDGNDDATSNAEHNANGRTDNYGDRNADAHDDGDGGKKNTLADTQYFAQEHFDSDDDTVPNMEHDAHR